MKLIVARISVACCFFVLGWIPSAEATYSIIAADAKTKQVGGAATSCVGPLSVSIVIGTVAGKGAIAAQARVDQLSLKMKTAGLTELVRNKNAPLTLDTMMSHTDPLLTDRQYAVVTTSGVSAYTGSTTSNYAGHRTGQSRQAFYSVQGNLLSSENVLLQTEMGFAVGESLAERLLNALESGADNHEGDGRCTPLGRPSDSAYLRVDNPDGSILIEIDIVGSRNPLSDLRTAYERWASSH
jgi:uncharacterized Ntn-hydrolase superfamily protein